MADSSFIQSQQNNLKRIFEQNAGTSYFAHLGIQDLKSEKDFDLLYRAFVLKVPITDQDGVRRRVARMTSDVVDEAEVYGRPNLLSAQKVVGFANDSGHVMPLTKNELKGFAAAERDLLTLLKQCKLLSSMGNIFDIYEPGEAREAVSSLRMQLFSYRPKKIFGFSPNFLPSPNSLDWMSRSRHQHLHGVIESLEKHGKKAEVVVGHPRTLITLSLMLAQKSRKFVPLTALCPNLKAVLCWGENVLPFRRELANFLHNNKPIQVLEFMAEAPGVVAWQDDPNISNWMRLADKTGVFYEFVPVENVYPDGRLHHNAKRLSIADTRQDKAYLLVASSPSGLLAYNTGWIVRIVSTDPYRIQRLRPSVKLNGFNEALGQGVFERLFAEVNEALTSYGFCLRDYILANDVDAKQPIYVFEVNKSLNGIAQDALQSVANKIYTELELRSKDYHRAFTTGLMKRPQIVFVALGTFAAQLEGGLPPHIDISPDASLAKQVMERAWEKVSLTAMDGVI